MGKRLHGNKWFRLRDQALERDQNMCRNCRTGANLEVHHVVPIRERGTNRLENLYTLCRDCHQAAHGHQRGTNKSSSTISPQRQVFSRETVSSICDSVDHPLSLATIVTIAKTGIGVGELCNLSIDDIELGVGCTGVINEFDGSGLVVRYGGDIRYSNRRERTQETIIPIDDQLEKILLRWLAIRPDPLEGRALFIETKNEWGKPLKPAAVRSIFENIGRKNGHYSTGDELSNFTPLSLRYFFTEQFRGPRFDREYILGTCSEPSIDFKSLEKEYHRAIFRL
jgi:integrase